MKQCTCYALRAIDCTCKPAKYGELYTTPTAKQEQGEPVTNDPLPRACNLAGVDYQTFLKIKAYMPVYTTPQQRKPLTDEQQKDAARYQWLRNPTIDVSLVLDKRTEWVEPDENVAGVGGYWMYEYRAGEELDAAIDTAIEAAQGIKE
jgi:hypothetical protein